MNIDPSGTAAWTGGFSGGAVDELIALMRSMVEVYGTRGAAQQLGVSDRTVYRWQLDGAMGPKLRDALVRRLDPNLNVTLSSMARRLDGLEAAFQSLRTEVDTLKSGQSRLAGELDELAREQEEQERTLLEEVAQLRVERKPPEPSRASLGSKASTTRAPAARGEPPADASKVEDPQRMALDQAVDRWERAKADGAGARSTLDAARARWEQLDAEIELLDRFEESLPPGQSWGYFQRQRELEWRKAALDERRREIRNRVIRRWVRRVCTLGLWRN